MPKRFLYLSICLFPCLGAPASNPDRNKDLRKSYGTRDSKREILWKKAQVRLEVIYAERLSS